MIEYLNYSGLSHFFDKLKAFFAKKTQSIKNISRNGTTFTATRADGSTFTFDQQTPAAATTTTAGLMPPLNQDSSTYLNGAGNWTNPTPSLVNIQRAGLAPNLSGDSTTFLDGTGNWATPPYPQTVNTQKAGLAPTLSGNSNTYLNGNGNWTTPTPPLVSEQNPGAIPALNGNSNTYFDGTGQWGIPVSPLATEYMQGSIPHLNGDSTTFLDGTGNWASVVSQSSAQILVKPRLKFFRLANGGGSNYLTLIFSQPPGSSDMFFVFGRANGDGGWNNSGTMVHGLVTFDDAYENVSQGAPVVLITGGRNGNFSINRVSTVAYQLITGPYARLWFLTTSETIMVQDSIQASESP